MKRFLTALTALMMCCTLALGVCAADENPAAPTGTPAAAEASVEGAASVISVKVTDTNGQEITGLVQPKQTVNIAVEINDTNDISAIPADGISAHASSGFFTIPQKAEVKKDTGSNSYTLLFKNVVYNGSTEAATASIDINYPDTTIAAKPVTVTVAQCCTATKAIPEDPKEAYIVAATVTNTAGGEVTEVKWGERCNVVLRIADYSAARTGLNEQNISARVNSTVFTFTGNAEVSQLYEATDEFGNDYYSYVLLFRDVIYNGSAGAASFPINLSYLDSNLEMQQIDTILGQCSMKDPEDTSKIRTSGFVVRDVNYGGSAVEIGTPFTLYLSIYSTTGNENLNDVLVSISLPEGVNLNGGTLSQFIGNMAPKSVQQVSFNLTATSAIRTSVASINVQMSGSGAATGTPITDTTTVSFPVIQPDRFTLGTLSLDDTYYAGSSGTVALKFINKSQTETGNLEATISGNNFTAEESYVYIGNLNAGTESSVDFDITPESAGPVSGLITLNYETHDGTLKTVTQAFNFDAEDMPVYDYGTDIGFEDFEPQPTRPAWVVPAAIVGALAVIGGLIAFIRKRRRAKALADLAAEDDFDDSESTNQ